jgi:hypothetical protein
MIFASVCLDFLTDLCRRESSGKASVPLECQDLMQQVNRIQSFQQFNMSSIYPEYFSKREIYIGPSTGKNIFVKNYQGKRAFVNEPLAKQDQLAFMVSHRLNFGVVPPTIALKGYENAFRISKLAQLHMGIGCVLQEGVPLHSHQIHMSNADKRALSEYAFDIDHLCRAVFFNIVVGRTDAGARNAVIDQFKRVMEIDNEQIGHTFTDSWLLDTFSDCVVSPSVIEDFLKKEASIIEDIFRDLEGHLSLNFWNGETCKLDSPNMSKVNILNNFKRLQSYLRENQEAQIKVGDLALHFTRCL